MSKNAMDWFRSWHGAPMDSLWLAIGRKAGVMPGVVSAVVWALLDHASQNDDRGSIAGFDVETYAAFSGFEEDQISATINALKDKGKIEDDRFVSWDRRQPKREDETAADRKRRQRERDREKGKEGDDTPPAEDTPGPDVSHDVTHDVTQGHDESRLDKDTDTDNPPKPPKGGGRYAPEFEDFWKAYRTTPNMAKETSHKAWHKVVPAVVSHADLLRAVGLYNAWLDGQGAKAPPVCHATTFLNQHRWQGFLDQPAAAPSAAAKAPWPKIRQQDWHARILTELGEKVFKTWFAPLWHEDGQIHCPTRFIADWVQLHYRDAIETAVGGPVSFTLKRPPAHAELTAEGGEVSDV